MQYTAIILTFLASFAVAQDAAAQANQDIYGQNSNSGNIINNNIAVAQGGNAVVAAAAPYQTSCTSTSTYPGTITVTDITTSTYCPVCDEAKSNGNVYTTTYETIYSTLCPTGLAEATYTVTNVCTGSTPINPETLVPGFTTTVVPCPGCPSATPTVTLTVPCDRTVTPVATATGTAEIETVRVPHSLTTTTTPAASTSPIAPTSSLIPFIGAASSLQFGLGSRAVGMASVFLGILLL
jgi:hypothetical protein